MKKYAVLTANGDFAVGEVTSSRAKVLVSQGTATWCPDRRAIQLVGSARPGLSIRPNAKLVERYAAARASNSDPLAIAAVDGAGKTPEGKGATSGWRKSGN